MIQDEIKKDKEDKAGKADKSFQEKYQLIEKQEEKFKNYARGYSKNRQTHKNV